MAPSIVHKHVTQAMETPFMAFCSCSILHPATSDERAPILEGQKLGESYSLFGGTSRALRVVCAREMNFKVFKSIRVLGCSNPKFWVPAADVDHRLACC
jgi:hypothetical protein